MQLIPRLKHLAGVAGIAIALSGVAAPACAQEAIGAASRNHLRSILEKTFLKVDVLALDLCLDDPTAARLADLAASPRNRALQDSVGRIVMRADSIVATIRFLRGISYSQFIGGILDEQRHAVDAGMLPDSTYRSISALLPEWFSFLENRNIGEGESITYHLVGNSVHTTYTDLQGEALLDRTDEGYWRRTSVLATWFAPGSGFRGGLLDSVWKPPRDAGPCAR